MIRRVSGVGVHQPPLERDVDGLVNNSRGEKVGEERRWENNERDEGAQLTAIKNSATCCAFRGASGARLACGAFSLPSSRSVPFPP